jgi:hypothetical protein
MLTNRAVFYSIVITMVLPAAAIAQPAGPQNGPAIIYTGETYGYLRSGDVGNNSMGAAFNDTYTELKQTYPQSILVGTGNNFAPEYGARFDSTGDAIARIPPSKSRNDWALSNRAVEFFQSPQHKYDALVPGQYDFYFGAEFLRNAGSTNGQNGQLILPLLGANLVITAQSQTLPQQPLCAPSQLLLPNQVSLPVQSGGGQSGGKGKGGGGGGSSKSGQGSSKSGQGSSSGGSSQSQACIPPPGTESSRPVVSLVNPRSEAIYPWSTEFEFNSTVEPTRVALCPVVSNKYSFSGCKALIPNSHVGQKNYSYHVAPQDVPIDPDGIIQSGGNSMLSPGRDAGLCVNPVQKNSKVDEVREPGQCVPFKVQTPLFAKAWVSVTKPGSGNGKYVIFGALDPAMRDLISNENSSWIANGSSIPRIVITDPASSIEQLVKAFEKVNSGVLDHSTIVLLAQMQPPAAKAFAASMAFQGIHFDVVISAADRDQKTPDMELAIFATHQPNLAYDREGTLQFVPPPVITPHSIVEDIPTERPGQLNRAVAQNPLELLEIDKSDGSKVTYTNSTERTTKKKLETIFAAGKDAFAKACSAEQSKQALQDLNLLSSQRGSAACNDSSEFKCIALGAMRDRLDADIAMLQARDFYDGCAYELGSAVREKIDRTLWNSGFLTRVSVSGATLRNILQASDAILASDRSSTITPLIPNRNLISLGITKANSTFYVDGVAIDDSKIYSIATSDQLALGDPAYPQFAQVDLIAPDVFTSGAHRTFRLADLATEHILNARPQPFRAAPLRAEQVMAALMPPLPNNQIPKSRQDNDNPFDSAKAGELKVQNRNFFTLTLQQLSVGYSFSKPNQTDTNIGQNLAGVTNPNVASPHSESLSYSDNFRLIRQFKTLINWGTDEQLTFARNRQGTLQPSNTPPTTPTGAPIPVDSISLSANTLILSPFLEFQNHRYNKRWKWIVLRPATFSTDIAKNRQFLKTASKNNVQYELVLERQRNWQPSVGSRYEIDSLNFFEAGYIHQEATNVLSGLTVNGMFSRLTAGTTAATVTSGVMPNTGDVAISTFNTFRQDGGYWLGMFTHRLPLPHTKVDYQGITFGNFFAYGSSAGTSTALTRYAVEFSNSLQISIWGNLSLAPSFNMFFFQDQSHLRGSSLVRRDLNLQLNYLFDWHQGLAWRDALRGKSN